MRRSLIEDDENAMVFSLAEAAAAGARIAVHEEHRLATARRSGAPPPAGRGGAASIAGGALPPGGGGRGGGGAPSIADRAPPPGGGGGGGAPSIPGDALPPGGGAPSIPGGAPPGGGGGRGALVGGVLPLDDAAEAAADGAANAIQVLVRLLRPSRRLLTLSELRQVQAASAAGASAGVRGAAFMVAMYVPPPVISPTANPNAPLAAIAQAQGPHLDLERVAAAAAAGAWNACYASVRIIPGSSAHSWATRLAPLLGACVGAAGALCPHFATASPWQTILVLGGIGVVLVTLMIGVAAVPTCTLRSDDVSRHAGFASFITITLLFVLVLCNMLHRDRPYLIATGTIGSVAILVLVYLWYRSGRHL